MAHPTAALADVRTCLRSLSSDNSGVKRKPYPSDISREKFAKIEPLLRSVRRSTKPIKQDLYEVFCAVLYLLRTGCQWRYLPPQFAKRSELHTFKVMPKCWVVERSFTWLEKNRRLWKNCERWLNTSLQFVHLAFLALLLRRS